MDLKNGGVKGKRPDPMPGHCCSGMHLKRKRLLCGTCGCLSGDMVSNHFISFKVAHWPYMRVTPIYVHL